MQGNASRRWHLYLHFKHPLELTGSCLFDVNGLHPIIRIVPRGVEFERRVWTHLNQENVSQGPFKKPLDRVFQHFYGSCSLL